jgi:hypothetical protein
MALSDESVRNLVAIGLGNCGLHFEVDPHQRSLVAQNIVADLPLVETGISLERLVFEELHEAERRLRRLHPTADRQTITLDQESMRARLRALDQTEGVQIVVVFPAGSVFAQDERVSSMLKALETPTFHHGVAEPDSTIDVKTAREVGHALASQLRDLLEILTRASASLRPIERAIAPKPSKPLVFLSYARKDDGRFKNAMALHLRGLEQSGLIELFVDERNIEPGQYWNEVIQAKLDQAYLAIFMLSAQFLASDFIMQLVLYSRYDDGVFKRWNGSRGTELSKLPNPAPGTSILVLSDLGALAASTWQEQRWLQRVRAWCSAGAEVLAWLPSAPGQVDSDIARVARTRATRCTSRFGRVPGAMIVMDCGRNLKSRMSFKGCAGLNPVNS